MNPKTLSIILGDFREIISPHNLWIIRDSP